MNKGQGLVSAIAACGLALLAALTISLWAGQARTWLGPLKDWLPTAPSLEQSGIRAAQAPEDAWSDKEIKTALMQCVQSLASITAEVVPLAPIRSGGCGTPAPVFVKSIGGTDNKVSFDPPLILDCNMVVGLDRWLKESVQPAARDVFSSAVLKIVGSSYACRNVYNLPNGRLSQHAFANAIDLPMFVLADGRTIGVTHGWGPTQRDLVAAAKAKKAAANATTSAGKPTTEKEAAGVSDVVKISTTSAPGSAVATGQSVASTVDPNALPKASFYVSRMMAAARYSLLCSVQRPTKSIGAICIWISRTESRRSANRLYATYGACIADDRRLRLRARLSAKVLARCDRRGVARPVDCRDQKVPP